MTATVYQFERFSRDDSVSIHELDYTDLDPILEICIDENSRGTTLSFGDSSKPHVQLPSPDKEFMDLLVKHSSDNTGTHALFMYSGRYFEREIFAYSAVLYMQLFFG